MPPESPDGTAAEDKKVEAEIKTQNAESSAAEGGKEPSMLDVVQSALQGKEESPASTEPDPKADAKESADEKPEPEKAEGEGTEDDEDLSEEERKHLSEKTQRRLKNLANAKKALLTDLEVLKPKAERFDHLVTYFQRNNLTMEDANNAMHIASLIRNDPFKALEAIEPIVTELKRLTGNTLPDDLREQVRLGYITQPAAEEVARERAARALRERKDREQAEEQRAAADQQARQEQYQQAISAADEWYAAEAARDPDFELKKDRIAEKAELAVMRLQGAIPTPADTKTMLGKIKREVDAEFRKFITKPSAPIQHIDDPASPAARPEPKNLRDVIDLVMGSR